MVVEGCCIVATAFTLKHIHLCFVNKPSTPWYVYVQVANFGTAEDDGSFWSRWIKPEAVSQAEVRISSVIYCRTIVVLDWSFSRIK